MEGCVGQLVGAPIMTAFIVFVGICGTSDSELAFGEAFWDPSILVSHFNQPIIIIIFSLFIILATLTTNVACNLAAASVVFSSLFSKMINYKQAVIVSTLLSICFLPWKLVENPQNYVYTLNGTLAVFLGPITGICLATLWSQYHNRLKLPTCTTKMAVLTITRTAGIYRHLAPCLFCLFSSLAANLFLHSDGCMIALIC